MPNMNDASSGADSPERTAMEPCERRAEIARVERERNEARSALRKLLLSRDAAWAGGHDWQEAIDEALAVLGIEGGDDE